MRRHPPVREGTSVLRPMRDGFELKGIGSSALSASNPEGNCPFSDLARHHPRLPSRVELRPSPRPTSLVIRGITPGFHPRREKPAFAMKADIDREHSPDPRDSQNHRSRREPLSIDDSDEGVLAASIIERRRYDAMLPSRNFVNRSRLRSILDLIVGIPFLLILLGIDVLRRK